MLKFFIPTWNSFHHPCRWSSLDQIIPRNIFFRLAYDSDKNINYEINNFIIKDVLKLNSAAVCHATIFLKHNIYNYTNFCKILPSYFILKVKAYEPFGIHTPICYCISNYILIHLNISFLQIDLRAFSFLPARFCNDHDDQVTARWELNRRTGDLIALDEEENPQSDRRICISELANRPESPGSLMYEVEGDSQYHVLPREPCPPFLYCTIALYTNGIRPSILEW